MVSKIQILEIFKVTSSMISIEDESNTHLRLMPVSFKG
jgi:hypothetical protein